MGLYQKFYLKTFKVVILTVMSLALLGSIVLLGMSAYQYVSRTPKKIEPAKPAPMTAVDPAELVKELAKAPEAAPVAKRGAVKTGAPVPKRASGKYLEEAKQLLDVNYKFQLQFDPKAKSPSEAQIEDLRGGLQRVSDADEDRGQAFATDLVKYVNAVLSSPEVIQAAKDGRSRPAFFRALTKFVKEWDDAKAKVKKHNAAEAARVEREKDAEAASIGATKAQSMASLTSAAMAFGAFLALAFYLIVAAVESNLRGIRESVRQSTPSQEA